MSDDTMKRKTFAESLNEDWGNPDIWGPWTVPDPSEGLKFYKSYYFITDNSKPTIIPGL